MLVAVCFKAQSVLVAAREMPKGKSARGNPPRGRIGGRPRRIPRPAAGRLGGAHSAMRGICRAAAGASGAGRPRRGGGGP